MSDYLSSFLVEPVLRQARRFSRISASTREDSPGFLSSVPVPDLQRWNPSRLWTASPPQSPAEEEVVQESTLQHLARNIQQWANQINNLDDHFPSPPLEATVDEHDERAHTAEAAIRRTDEVLPEATTDATLPLRPTALEELRTNSETSMNPARGLFTDRGRPGAITRGHSNSDPLAAIVRQLPLDHVPMSPTPDNDPQSDTFRRRFGSGALPEDDGMGPLRQRITAIWAAPGTPTEKSRLVHAIMTERYRSTQPNDPRNNMIKDFDSPARPLSPVSIFSGSDVNHDYKLRSRDFEPTYAPLDKEEDAADDAPELVHPKLGCVHYRRNVKMQCAACERWYPCRLCHDEVESHTLPRRETKYMLCMLCHTPQRVGQTCTTCKTDAAYYYCNICKLWNNDPDKSIYHCEDCGICRLGKGLGKDFFHCKTCAACMSIQAEQDHRCIERSTKCDCPICGEYMFTSNQPVAFMKCGHSIHETCFAEWCQASYKCPICSRSIANMESQFRRLDRHIEDQPMPEEYRDNRAYIFCNDCNSRSITKYHWLGLKCALCDSYNTAQLELLGAERTPQLQEQEARAQETRDGEAGITASQSHTPSAEFTVPANTTDNAIAGVQRSLEDVARSPPARRDSPWLLPHSPIRSVRSVSPVVGSYFGTGSRGTPVNRATPVNDEDEDLDFWGGQSPRSQETGPRSAREEESEDESESDEEMVDEDDDEDEDDPMDILIGHR